MSEFQSPSTNPADDGTITGLLKTAIRKELQNLDKMMPVEVVAFDRATNRATVKHLIQMEGTNGEKVDRAQVASVRILQPGNNAFSISLPIKPGDKGWLMAADRDMSLFQQALEPGAPNTARMHSFQDGMMIPDAMPMGNVHPDDADRVVIAANNGSARISFDGDTINFNVGGASSIVQSADTTTVTMGGVVVAISAAGVAITGGTVTHNGLNIGSTHVHGGVVSGGDDTAGPH